IASFALVGGLALGLASVQIIPTLEWVKEIGEAFNPWPPLARFQALGWVSRDILRDPNSAGIEIPEAAAYVGMITLLVAPLAVLHRPRLYSVFFSSVAIGAIAIAYGVEPIQTVVRHIPVLGALKNYRMLVADCAVAGLSGLGISALEKHAAWTRRER